MNDYVHSLKKAEIEVRVKFAVVCNTANFIPVLIHEACAIMRVSVLMLLIDKDTLRVSEARFDLKNNLGLIPGVGDFEGKVLRESSASHLMVPVLPESLWEFHDSFVPSETAGHLVFSTNVMNETFSVKRLPRSRTIRDLMITSGRG